MFQASIFLFRAHFQPQPKIVETHFRSIFAFGSTTSLHTSHNLNKKPKLDEKCVRRRRRHRRNHSEHTHTHTHSESFAYRNTQSNKRVNSIEK